MKIEIVGSDRKPSNIGPGRLAGQEPTASDPFGFVTIRRNCDRIFKTRTYWRERSRWAYYCERSRAFAFLPGEWSVSFPVERRHRWILRRPIERAPKRRESDCARSLRESFECFHDLRIDPRSPG